MRSRTSLPALLLPAFFLGLWTLTSTGQDSPTAPPIRVLLVTGEDVPAHDWRATTRQTRELLTAPGEVEVRVSEDIGILESRSALEHADVLVLNFRNNPVKRDLSEEGRKNLLEFARRGKGIVVLHFALAAFHNWPEYQELLGLYWKRKVSKHDPRGVFPVSVKDREHPITRGVEDFEIYDECAARLQVTRPHHVLLESRAQLTGKLEPQAWTIEPPAGRIFCLALGHEVRSRQHPAFGQLLRQGVRWAAKGRQTSTSPSGR